MWPAKLLKDYTVGTKGVEHRRGVCKEEEEKKNPVPSVQSDCIPGKCVWAPWTSAEGNIKTRCPDKRRTNENNLNGRFIITEQLCPSVLIGLIVGGKTGFFSARDNTSDEKL